MIEENFTNTLEEEPVPDPSLGGDPPPDPPPIIIKSGSFIIESDENLEKPSGGNDTYKRKNFGEIKAVRVIKTNEITGAANSHAYTDENGVEVEITLQNYSGGSWQNTNPPVIVKSQSSAGSAIDFTLTIGKVLSANGHAGPDRKERLTDDGTDIIRFGRVIVRENGGGGGVFDTTDGEDYIITFYNRLA
ncbi:MAG: hypothetical protein JWN60_3071 [Acidobacteria bacterium]|jgi:hypothetical protein|nr:hypothetical protein [Acidobacteriota bacterium]